MHKRYLIPLLIFTIQMNSRAMEQQEFEEEEEEMAILLEKSPIELGLQKLNKKNAKTRDIKEGIQYLQNGASQMTSIELHEALKTLKKRELIYNGSLDTVIARVQSLSSDESEYKKIDENIKWEEIKGIIPRKTAWTLWGYFRSPYQNNFDKNDYENNTKYIINITTNPDNQSDQESLLQLCVQDRKVKNYKVASMQTPSSMLGLSMMSKRICYCKQTQEPLKHMLCCRSIDNPDHEEQIAPINAKKIHLIRFNMQGDIALIITTIDKKTLKNVFRGYAYCFNTKSLYLLSEFDNIFTRKPFVIGTRIYILNDILEKKPAIFSEWLNASFCFKDNLITFLDNNFFSPQYTWHIHNALAPHEFIHSQYNTAHNPILDFKKQSFLDDLDTLKQLQAVDVTQDTIDLAQTLKNNTAFLNTLKEEDNLLPELSRQIKRLQINSFIR